MQRSRLLVKPGSKFERLVFDVEKGFWIAFVREKPVQGKANLAVLKLLKSRFKNPRIVSGFHSRFKVFEFESLKP
ncbi:DUF167 domain-containing protein [Candidatus Woesearchaeota archaeon]|nr:DUF167 domain-containing protein [Candidatus Woesearchaeota archaeon]